MQTAHWSGAGLLVLASLLGAPACGGGVTTPGSAGSASGAGADAGGGQSTASTSGGGGAGGGHSTTASTSGGGGAGSICSAFSGTTCPPDQYCEYGTDSCGGLDENGTCTPRPTDCPPDNGAPTCACDGKTYASDCAAHQAGFDVANSGGCTAPPGTFACGKTFCETGAEYCLRSTSDVGGYPDGYSCIALPAPCLQMTPPSCDCLKDQPCGDLCEITAPGGIQLTCPGG